jgi:hypothetical protein
MSSTQRRAPVITSSENPAVMSQAGLDITMPALRRNRFPHRNQHSLYSRWKSLAQEWAPALIVFVLPAGSFKAIPIPSAVTSPEIKNA